MPKADSQEPSSSTSKVILKKYQACHQCRRRKSKCDGARPHCSTCTRLHNLPRKSGDKPEGDPDCTWDDPPEERRERTKTQSKTKYARLESRINELESLLKNQDDVSKQPEASTSSAPPQYSSSKVYLHPVPGSNSVNVVNDSPSDPPHQVAEQQSYPIPSPTEYPASSSPSSYFGTPAQSINQGYPSSVEHSPYQELPSTASDVLYPFWPPRLPPPYILNHLVETFFHSIPLASRILHRPSFLLSLTQPPTSPTFPATALLHSICAIASLYTMLPSSRLHSAYDTPAAPFNVAEATGSMEHRFGELQASYSKQERELAKYTYSQVFQCLQSVVIVGWYHHRRGHFFSSRFVELWGESGNVIRSSIPLGLNSHVPIPRPDRPTPLHYIILPPANATEMELRVNTWWCAYALDRLQMATSRWCVSIEDQDVTQILPIRLEDFENGLLISQSRQRLNRQDLLTNHPRELMDGFALYAKGTYLVSRIRIWRHRFNMQADEYAAEDIPFDHDPRPSIEFQALDQAVFSFRNSFPPELSSPVDASGHVDPILFAAHCVSLLAILTLHAPHVDFEDQSNPSRGPVLEACGQALQLIYSIGSTSYDLSLLDPVCSSCWHLVGRNLVHYWKSVIPLDLQEAENVRSEIQIIKLALSQMGRRLELSRRHEKLLDRRIAIVLNPNLTDEFACPGQELMVRPAGDDIELDSRPPNDYYNWSGSGWVIPHNHIQARHSNTC